MANKKKLEDTADIIGSITAGSSKRTLPGKYRFSLVMPEECQHYLERASYNASEPGHIVSINQYINDLIKLDMKEGGLIKYHEGKDSADNGGK